MAHGKGTYTKSETGHLNTANVKSAVLVLGFPVLGVHHRMIDDHVRDSPSCVRQLTRFVYQQTYARALSLHGHTVTAANKP